MSAVKNATYNMAVNVASKDDKIKTPFLEIGDLRRMARENRLDTIHVLNMSDKGGTRDKGEILVPITDGNGEVKTMAIPLTFAPFDLTTLFDAEAIVKSSDFARLIASGNIVVLKEEIAKRLFEESEDLRDERERVSSGHAATTYTPPKTLEEKAANVNPTVMRIVNEERPEREKVLELKNISTLSRDDYEYIQDNSAGDTLKRFATEGLAALEGSPSIA